MIMPKLIKPCPKYLKGYLSACQGYKDRGLIDYFPDPDTVNDWGPGWFDKLDASEKGAGLKEGYVPSSSFWLVEGDDFIGEGDIRHSLTPALKRFGGHIGYAIRADKWGRGYGGILLAYLLRETAALGIGQALITCSKDNTGSIGVITKNGGIYFDTVDNVVNDKPRPTNRYLVHTSPFSEGIVLDGAFLYDMDEESNDIGIYLNYAAPRGQNKSVLDLGCGTGRISIPLAISGFNVTGIDLSQTMLAVFKDKVKSLSNDIQGRIKLYPGDMTEISFNEPFGLIIAAGCSFQALTYMEDVLSCLKNVYECLDDNGIFIVSLSKPWEKDRIKDSVKLLEHERLIWEKKSGYGLVTKYVRLDSVDTQKQILRNTVTYKIETDKGIETRQDSFAKRYYQEGQFEDILEKSGFYIEEVIESKDIVFVCRKRD